MFAKNNSNIKILSYEPIKTTYEKQKRNIKLNNLNQNIEVFNYGLSNRSNDAYFETKRRIIINSLALIKYLLKETKYVN